MSFGFTSFASIERGQELYSQVCFYCHGNELEGGKGPSLKDEYWSHGSSPKSILTILNKGVPGTEMIGYQGVFPQSDIKALQTFILSKQKGVRELLREEYKNQHFTGLELTHKIFEGTESSNQKIIPENTFWVDNRFAGSIRFQGVFYAWEDGLYDFNINGEGRTLVYIQDELITRIGKDIHQERQLIKSIQLTKGAYKFEILHESKRKFGHRIAGNYGKTNGERIQFHGRSLQGNVPKLIKSNQIEAKVVRKWIRNIAPRSLLCLLPNNVIVAYNPQDRKIEKAWHSALINQTPSLPDRSAAPSKIQGTEIKSFTQLPEISSKNNYLGYQVKGASVIINTSINGQKRKIVITPDKSNSFKISEQP